MWHFVKNSHWVRTVSVREAPFSCFMSSFTTTTWSGCCCCACSTCGCIGYTRTWWSGCWSACGCVSCFWCFLQPWEWEFKVICKPRTFTKPSRWVEVLTITDNFLNCFGKPNHTIENTKWNSPKYISLTWSMTTHKVTIIFYAEDFIQGITPEIMCWTNLQSIDKVNNILHQHCPETS